MVDEVAALQRENRGLREQLAKSPAKVDQLIAQIATLNDRVASTCRTLDVPVEALAPLLPKEPDG